MQKVRMFLNYLMFTLLIQSLISWGNGEGSVINLTNSGSILNYPLVTYMFSCEILYCILLLGNFFFILDFIFVRALITNSFDFKSPNPVCIFWYLIYDTGSRIWNIFHQLWPVILSKFYALVIHKLNKGSLKNNRTNWNYLS